MRNVWAGRLAARSFRAAIDSPLVAGRLRLIDVLSKQESPEVLDWQDRRFNKVMTTARRFTSYYRSANYANEDRLAYPTLVKEVVRVERDRMRNRLVPARPTTTGGSGGPPLLVYVSHASFLTEWAHIAYAWRFGGVSVTDPKITFRGSSLGQGFQKDRVIYQHPYNQMLVSPFHLNDETFRHVIYRVRDFGVRAIWGYPSAVTAFAKWVLENGPFKELSTLKAVLLGSEMSFDWQLKIIDEALGARIVRWYGQTEKVSFATECQLGSGYHVIPTYGLTEVLDGRIVASGFTNSAMPLIRYNTEDEGFMTTVPCSCGLPFPRLSTVTGRSAQAMLWGHDDEPISLTAINFHDPIFIRFARFQFKQEEAGKVTLLLVPASEAGVDDRAVQAARHYLQNRAGGRLDVDVVLAGTDELLTERGKALAIDQRYKPHDPR